MWIDSLTTDLAVRFSASNKRPHCPGAAQPVTAAQSSGRLGLLNIPSNV
jgi:hypothetical protein